MIVWWRNADADEAAFLTLVAHESGAPSGLCAADTSARAACTRVVTTDGVVSGFYRLAHDLPCGHAELDHLYVLAHRRGLGLGRMLVSDLHRTAGQLGLPGVRIVAHPPSERFFVASGARRIATEPPSPAVPWVRPVLHLDVAGAPAVAVAR